MRLIRPPFPVASPLALALVVIATAAGPSVRAKKKDAPELPALNQKVIGFARERLGEKVGNGQCTSLAAEALDAAGAKRFPMRGLDGDYVWGRPLATFREALPGDLLQFRDAVFRGKTFVTSTRWVSWHQTYPHHTAIVSEVRDGGKLVVILHQNVGADGTTTEAKQVVTEATLRTDSLQKGGHIWIYRPDDPDDDPD